MKFGILVNEGPYTHQASDSAYLFTRAALEKGHEIYRVFFYHDGVNNATKYTEPPQDDRHIVNRWSKLAEQYEVDLVVCVAAALRRGIKDELLAPGFRISGLGQLVEAGIQGDRLVVFGIEGTLSEQNRKRARVSSRSSCSSTARRRTGPSTRSRRWKWC